MQTNQKPKNARTQVTLSQAPSRLIMERATNANDKVDNHMSAGVLSINSMKGPDNQKILKKRSRGESSRKASKPSFSSCLRMAKGLPLYFFRATQHQKGGWFENCIFLHSALSNICSISALLNRFSNLVPNLSNASFCD